MRFFDLFFSIVAILLLSPLMLVTALIVFVASPGNVFYVASRTGLRGRHFRMLKFRTMHAVSELRSEITAPNDARIIPFGHTIRLLKLDELPQLWNVLVGDMSIVGPRPESVVIVQNNYERWMLETLEVRPGLTSVGALYGYSFGDRYLSKDDPELSYIDNLLPRKIAVEIVGLRQKCARSDLSIIVKTAKTILQSILGRNVEFDEKTLLSAQKILKDNGYNMKLF